MPKACSLTLHSALKPHCFSGSLQRDVFRNLMLGNCMRLLLQVVLHVMERLEITAENESLGSSDVIPNPFCPLEWY